MYKYTPSTHINSRIEIADILRGIAIGGITIWHFIEHMNFWNFPEFTKLDRVTYDIFYFLFCGKMYAIFALLFGLSMFIQHDNQAKKGLDFRLRFSWRMIVLILIGLFDLCFYNGDILFVYAICGLLIIPFIRKSNELLQFLCILFLLQPIEIICFINSLINSDAAPLSLNSQFYFGELFKVQESGSFTDVALAGLKNGVQINMFYAIESGRLTQTIGLFLLGILIGRKRLFYNEGNNQKKWEFIILTSFVMFTLLTIIFYLLDDFVQYQTTLYALSTIINIWKNLFLMLFLVFSITHIYYNHKICNRLLSTITPYGRMSLTNYIGQSIVGAFLFYNWGLGLFRTCGHFESMLIGVFYTIIQFHLCRFWLKHHKKGPFETLWHKLTWIKLKSL